MQKLLDLLERFLGAVLTFFVDRVPMPARVRDLVRSKKKTLHEIVKFGIAGIGATVVYWPIYLVLITLPVFRDPESAWHVSTYGAIAIANVPAILLAYWISARFVFAGHSGHDRRLEVVMFFVMNAAAVALAEAMVWFVEWLFEPAGGRLPQWAEITVVIVSFLLSWALRFVFARRFIFKAHLERPAVDVATELAHLVDEIEEETGERFPA